MKIYYLILTFLLCTIYTTRSYAQNDHACVLKNTKKSSNKAIDFSSQVTRNSSSYDLKHHILDLIVDPNSTNLEGSVSSRYEVLTSDFDNICFSLTDNMIVDSVIYHNTLLPSSNITHNNHTISIDLLGIVSIGTIDSIKIYYHGNATNSIEDGYNITTECNNPAVWTLSEPFGAAGWWPCKQSLDDKIDSVDIIITTPMPNRVASNGLLQSIDTINNDVRYHWKHNYLIPAYLVAIGVAEYDVYSDYVEFTTGDSLEVLNYVYPCETSYAMTRTPFTIDAMILFDSLFGTYPFIEEKYGHASFGCGCAMEHQTMSFMGGWGYYLIAHELAHQWFGDKVTCEDWQHIWLNEGWATYLEGLTQEYEIKPVGNDWKNWLTIKRNNVTSSPGGSVFVPADDADNVNRIFNARLSYNKGAFLIHMLRWILGDTDFYAAANNYLNDMDIAYDYALTHEFQQHLEDESGIDLDEFFDDWFYGEGHPIYNITWSQDIQNKLYITVDQTQSHASVDFFNIPIPIYFENGSIDTTIIVDPSFSGEQFEIPINFEATSMTFDPDVWILAKSNVALPLILERFEGQYQNEGINLEWTTSNEINIDRIVLEKSIDGRSFYPLVSFEERNNGRYTFQDKEINFNINNYYYRLKILDVDASKTYSNVLKIVLKPDSDVFQISPNPVKDIVNLSVNSSTEKQVKINIYDMNGKLVEVNDLYLSKGNADYKIDFGSFSNGSYFLHINGEGLEEVIEFIKQ